MYCPNCSTENIQTAHYCRACGANLTLVPQALTGHLPDAQESYSDRRRRRRREPSLGRGITRTIIAIAFLLLAAGITFSGQARGGSGLPLLILAFFILGRGISELASLLNSERRARQLTPPSTAANTSPLPPTPVFERLVPPSVTEGTTRHLDSVSQEPRNQR